MDGSFAVHTGAANGLDIAIDKFAQAPIIKATTGKMPQSARTDNCNDTMAYACTSDSLLCPQIRQIWANRVPGFKFISQAVQYWQYNRYGARSNRNNTSFIDPGLTFSCG